MNSVTASRRERNLPSTSAVSKRPSEDSGEEPPREKRRASTASSGEDVSRTDENGRSPLHLAAIWGDVQRVRQLVGRGADTRLRDRWGQTPLHCALDWGEEAAANLLVEADCSNDVQNEYWSTPLHLAAGRGYLKTIRRLLAGGSRTRARDLNGRTPLHRALECTRGAAVKLLLEADCSNDVLIEDGRTPLHYAAERLYQGVVRKIIQSGTDPHVKDSLGQYPIQLALRWRRGNESIPEMILSSYALRGIPVDREELQLSESDLRFCIEALSRCQAEIRLMRCTRVPVSSISYLDLVTRHVARVALRLPVEGLPGISRSRLARRDFPVYAGLIASKLRKTGERRVRMDHCQECFSLLSPPLPLTCVNAVLVCLSDGDLENFHRAVRHDGSPGALGEKSMSPGAL